MKNTKDTHEHHGHRKRLRNLIDMAGFDALSEVQVVEQILTMTHARCDTNVIAHRLLNEFGSLSKILDADAYDLMQIEGVGEVTAKTITYLPQIFDLYLKDKNSKKYTFKNYKDIYNFFSPIFEMFACECVVVGFISNNNTFSGYKKLADGELCEVKINKVELSKSIIRNKAKAVMIAHNHPVGKATPSSKDYDANERIAIILENLGIVMIDNVIIGEDGIFSFKNNILFPKNDI